MNAPLSPRQVAQYAYDAGFRGRSLETAVAVALAESGGHSQVRGDVGLQDHTWGPSVGLWQIRSLHADRGTGRTRDELANLRPATNARHARRIWRERGDSFAAWATYTNGTYRSFLDQARDAVRQVSHSHRSHQGDHDSRPGGHRTSSRVSTLQAGRIVLDLGELTRLERLMATSRDRVQHTQRAVHDIATDLAVLRDRLDPGSSSLIDALIAQVTGPAGLEMVIRHLDYEERLVHRTRTLAEAADGGDGRYTTADAIRFLRTVKGRIDLPEAAVLEALVAGGLRLRHRHDPGHRRNPGPAQPTHHAPSRVTLPSRRVENTGDPVPESLRRFANGRLPAGRLARVGDGEQMWSPAARQFRRMDAAARTAGLDLHVKSGYRTYSEQAVLYERYQRGQGNLAASPGRSTHGWGLSADIDVTNSRVHRWLQTNAARFGFFPDVPSEPWHWTYRPR